MKLKKLNNESFTMKLIKDLGMVNGRRMAIFECLLCKDNIKCRTDSHTAKRDNGACLKCRTAKEANANGRIGQVWVNMIQRCYNKNNPQFKDYGDRGIFVCDEWRNNFDLFKQWALKNGYDDNLFIDRIDNDKEYAPYNCRFVNRCIQNQNRRIYKISSSNYRGVSKYNNKWRSRISINGERISLGLYDSKEEAAIAYNDFIIDNNLDYILNIIKYFQK